MAIIKCLECGQSVSDQARTCPHCGAMVNRRAEWGAGVMSLFRIIMLLGFVLAGVGGFMDARLWILAVVFLILGVAVKRVA